MLVLIPHTYLEFNLDMDSKQGIEHHRSFASAPQLQASIQVLDSGIFGEECLSIIRVFPAEKKVSAVVGL
jgi:hypothetical protein